jgi:hypothetical protein
MGPEGPDGNWLCVLDEGHEGLHSSAADAQWSTDEQTGVRPKFD